MKNAFMMVVTVVDLMLIHKIALNVFAMIKC